nr:MAG TPA: hypothetical protein [Caudoviricetes sp.]
MRIGLVRQPSLRKSKKSTIKESSKVLLFLMQKITELTGNQEERRHENV